MRYVAYTYIIITFKINLNKFKFNKNIKHKLTILNFKFL